MFSPLAVEHIQRPRNQGPPERYTHYGVSGEPGGGPYAEIWLTVESGVIRSASYRTHGCPSSVGACSVLCTISTGRELERVITLTGQELLLILGGLPDGKERFAMLACAAFSAVARVDERINGEI